jgi:FkbM family methyltransferase
LNRALKLSFSRYALRLVRAFAARALSRRRLAAGAARIACFPGDDIGDKVIAHGWYEDLLLAVLFEEFLRPQREAFARGVAVDVGANIGNHSLWYSRLFAKVLSFEPNPICTRLFEASVLMNAVANVQLLPFGLSDIDETLEFFSNQTSNLGRSGVSPHLAERASASFPVSLRRGDSVLTPALLGSLPVRLIKLDIEGHELRALRGLRDTIQTFGPLILFESNGSAGAGGSDAIVDQLSAWGYAHYYVVEKNTCASTWRVVRALHRVLQGYQLSVVRVERPSDKSYGLVVAAKAML